MIEHDHDESSFDKHESSNIKSSFWSFKNCFSFNHFIKIVLVELNTKIHFGFIHDAKQWYKRSIYWFIHFSPLHKHFSSSLLISILYCFSNKVKFCWKRQFTLCLFPIDDDVHFPFNIFQFSLEGWMFYKNSRWADENSIDPVRVAKLIIIF